MEKKQQVIISYFRDQQSQRRISRELGISRPTVKKYILSYLCETNQGDSSGDLQASGILEIPVYDIGNRSKGKLTEEVCAQIDGYLSANAQKRMSGKAKQEMKNVDIHEALEESGYSIGYTTVCLYVRAHSRKSKEVYIRQQYAPGESVEFDWGEVKLEIAGLSKRLMLAVFSCCHSNHRWSMLFYRQDMSSFLQSHVSYFSAVGGVARELVYDNMRVAVRRFARRNKDKVATEELLKLSAYYQFDYRFCNRGKGNEKGHVERSVEFVRRKAFCREDCFETLAQANAHLGQVCTRLNQRTTQGESQSILQRFVAGASNRHPVGTPYEACELSQLKVNKYSCVKIDLNYYSVLEGYVGKWLEAKVYPARLEIFSPEGTVLATHERSHTRFQYYIKLEHYLQTLSKKPGALARSVAWHQVDSRINTLFDTYFTHQPKGFIDLLLWARKEQISIDQVAQAATHAYRATPSSPLSLDTIKLLATQQMNPHLSPSLAQQKEDQIQQQAAEQLREIQSLFFTHS